MTDAPDPWNVAGIIGGITAACTGLWTGIKWLVRRSDDREVALDRREAELIKNLEGRVKALEASNQKNWLVLSYVVPALYALDPNSSALKAARLILGDELPIPPDMAATLEKIL